MKRLAENKSNIDGTTFQVPAEDFVCEDDGNVYHASFGKGGLRFALLGYTFLKNNSVVFNQEVPEVQIAPTRYYVYLSVCPRHLISTTKLEKILYKQTEQGFIAYRNLLLESRIHQLRSR
ncbi:hypothetical protein A0J61_05925 [Choanephora cucurbitarum]|uniref:Peptidase A1 domain-containing protein n=1 Tax=Choanephora cucurbitarum TaxID=101091 RepID=A0A1C7NBL4_9FUNG|nr:hypothetical protein A0J61_05925 [Choanephora cucurbitarum]